MCAYTVATPDHHDTHFPTWPSMAAYDSLYMEMEDPIPPEDRCDVSMMDTTTTTYDNDQGVSREAESAIRSSRRLLAGSFHEWMRQTFMEEEAARKIQQFVRPRLPSGSMLLSDEKLRGTDTTLSFVTMDVEEDQDDEDHLQYEVFLWHGSYLGLEFYSCDITGFACVDDSNGNDSLPGMWNLRQGDYLISINDYSAHKDSMPFDAVEQILEDGVRPAILRFRRPRIQEVRFRSSLSRISSGRAMSAAKKEMQMRRERLERSLCYVVWREEDGPLGIVLKPDRSKPYPTVSEVSPTGVVARETQRNLVRAGDLLLSINHMDVSAMGYRKSLEIMKFAPRPLVLTFRRSTPDYPVVRSLEL